MRHRVQGIIIQNGRVIFGHGCVDKSGKIFRHFFIGGAIELSETLEEAILREIMEEMNVKGEIIFKFKEEIYENSTTFLVDIDSQKPIIGYDPEDVNEDVSVRALQKLIFIPLKDRSKFTTIDVNYFKLLLNECKARNYYPKYYNELLELTTQFYNGEIC